MKRAALFQVFQPFYVIIFSYFQSIKEGDIFPWGVGVTVLWYCIQHQTRGSNELSLQGQLKAKSDSHSQPLKFNINQGGRRQKIIGGALCSNDVTMTQGGSRHIQTGWAKNPGGTGKYHGGGCPKRHFQGGSFCKHLWCRGGVPIFCHQEGSKNSQTRLITSGSTTG